MILIYLLCLPYILKSISIEPDNQTKIEIQNPGIAAIQKSIRGFGSIYLLDGDNQSWVINIGSNSNKTESVYLQPGNYRLVFRSKYNVQSATTVEKRI